MLCGVVFKVITNIGRLSQDCHKVGTGLKGNVKGLS